jgi:hypothetical protein
MILGFRLRGRLIPKVLPSPGFAGEGRVEADDYRVVRSWNHQVLEQMDAI